MAVNFKKLMKLSFVLNFLFIASSSSLSSFSKVPPTCQRLECPSYTVLDVGHNYEIRLLNSTVWASYPPFPATSFVQATKTGFIKLFDYIQGNNNYHQKIEMTAPVITEVAPGYGPFGEDIIEVSFYVPKKNQANPPLAKGIVVSKVKPVYAAVRQFSGFVSDSNVGDEFAALKASIAGIEWSSAIEKSKRGGHGTVYSVAQYNDPLDYEDRVNEIWLLFDMENGWHSV